MIGEGLAGFRSVEMEGTGALVNNAKAENWPMPITRHPLLIGGTTTGHRNHRRNERHMPSEHHASDTVPAATQVVVERVLSRRVFFWCEA